ncbi:hypothetical protein OK016_16845 [Vibrio chagasii]|nr:hypothetical protein [Vibrio chagasii]
MQRTHGVSSKFGSLINKTSSLRITKGCRTDWWVFWRRVAGGLNQEQQETILADIAKYATQVQ